MPTKCCFRAEGGCVNNFFDGMLAENFGADGKMCTFV